MSDPVLRIESLSYRYPGAGRAALDGIDLEIGQGELVLVAGASGSGKSTLVRGAAGLVPHFFGGTFAGRIVVGGLDTRKHGPAELASIAGTLFQEPETQVVMNRVQAELSLALENRGQPPAAVARAVEETALALGLGNLLERPVETLSGGELQRVALAAALASLPRLLLLDEPTSALDPVAGDELVWQLRRLNEEWGTAVVLVEHRVERCLAAADRVVGLDHGRVAFDGPPRDFVAWAVDQAEALAPPVARMCAEAGLRPPPIGVKDGRALLRSRGIALAQSPATADRDTESGHRRLRLRRRPARKPAALALDSVWVEYDDGTGAGLAALRGLSLELRPGETVALVGRNGAGKSTLLRVAAGLRAPDRGRVHSDGEVALVLQSPSDFFLHDRARDELPSDVADAALAELALTDTADANPRDLSGGERQRLALAVVLAGRGVGGGAPPPVVALDEPTRGMDRAQKEALAARLRTFARSGSAVIVATHDVEFAARLSDRCVLLARGRVVADGPTRELLSGGRYFATEVARTLGADAYAVLPEQGAKWLASRLGAGDAAGEVSVVSK